MDFPTRYDLLKTVISRYDGYYHLSAVKASLLLTTNVILLAAVVNEESGLKTILAEGGAARILLLGGALLALVSMIFAILVIASWLTGRRRGPVRPSVVFSSSVARTDVDDYLAGIEAIDEPSLIEDMSRLAHDLSVVLAKKFRLINVSLAAFLGAVIVAVLAYLASWPAG